MRRIKLAGQENTKTVALDLKLCSISSHSEDFTHKRWIAFVGHDTKRIQSELAGDRQKTIPTSYVKQRHSTTFQSRLVTLSLHSHLPFDLETPREIASKSRGRDLFFVTKVQRRTHTAI